ncbi:FAD-dependent monooxygenase [Streptomyces ochraceiscleroticus]|uniref:FAD-dependent monooxygenase n=1 Tax=Streptomyces ochraceiscleroticus TaxID=47761 RepID=A0ABW1MFS9_9ACTN|nr:FAD-dependent monooxygenase [Streptomyces ochraceiscleroticus]
MTVNRNVDVDVEVLVAGAGPTGLALGIDLARRGVRALVVERQDRLSPGARGTGLQPRTQEVYDDLGVLPAVRAAGGPYPPMATWQDGRKTDVFEMVERVAPTPHTPYADTLMIPQWRHLELLHGRLAELGGAVAFGTELTAIGQDAAGVTAELNSAADGTTRTVRAAYLVGADGGRSVVRRHLGVPMSGPDLPPGAALLADLRIDGLDRDHWHRFPQPHGGFVMLLPLAGTDHFQCMAAVSADTPDTSPEAVRATVAAHTHLTAGQIREVLWTSVFRPRAGMAERFRDGRIFLAGDAAHIHSPAGGQGLNTSVQDAYNLGWKLGQVLRHGAPDALLDTYGTERLPVAAGILETSTRLHRSGSWRRGRELHQLTLHYRESPLTAEHRDGLAPDALRAGDRAPDAPCATPSGAPFRLFDAFRGPHFTLLAIGDTELPRPADEWPAHVHTYRIGGHTPDLTDPESHAQQAYGPGLFLIRPDGYVTVAATEPGPVAAELGRHFPSVTAGGRPARMPRAEVR